MYNLQEKDQNQTTDKTQIFQQLMEKTDLWFPLKFNGISSYVNNSRIKIPFSSCILYYCIKNANK